MPAAGDGAAGRPAAATVNESDLSVSLIDLRTQEIVAASESVLELLEIDRSEVIGHHVGEFTVGGQNGALPMLASGHLDGAEADRIVKGPDGEAFPVHAWTHVIGSERPARYAILMLLDRRPSVTGTAAGEEVRVYGAVDVQWRIDHVSSGIGPLLGYDPDDVAGMALTRLIHPNDFPGVFSALAATHTSRLGALARVRLRPADGTWRPCRMRIAPLSQAPGFGFILRPLNDPDPNEGPATDLDKVLHRLSEYLLVEQSQQPPPQLPTSSELPALGKLSSTEWEVLLRLNTGASQEDISYALRRDPRTVRLHLGSIFDKLGVATTEELTSLLAAASGMPVS